jgi:RNA-dependent RNA polymerase
MIHTAFADALGMNHRYALRLAELHYKASQSAESGDIIHMPLSFTSTTIKFPHYLGKPAAMSRHSTSIVGKLFDLVTTRIFIC